MDEQDSHQQLLSLTTEIVASFAGNHAVAKDDLPGIISSVFEALRGMGKVEEAKPVEAPTPAVAIKRSVMPEYIICLEDGKKLKMLKRHLKTRYNMTPDEYRKRWSLPHDYPMVAPSYAEQRSKLAKQIGLGRKPAPVAAAPEPAPSAKGAKRRAAGRKQAA